MIRHGLGLLQRAAAFEVIGDARDTHGVIADFRFDARPGARRSMMR